MAEGSVQKIDTSTFQDAMDKINKALNAFKTSKSSITNSTDLLLSTWSGKGKNSFNAAFTLLKTELADEEDNLQTIYDDLKSIKESYDEWDATSKNLLNQDN